jgi:thiol-disulfide isomerase/thioredoxin
MKATPLRWMLVIVLSCITTLLTAATPQTLSVGSVAPDFELRGFVIDKSDTSGAAQARDGVYRLQDFARSRVLVLIFTCNHCPTAQAYEPRIMKLVDDYRDKGVSVVCITSNDPQAVRLDELGYTDLGDSYEDTKIRALALGWNCPYLYDGDDQSVAQAYGAMATPHVFVFDRERTLRYTGRIDNSEDWTKVKQQDTRAAIDALLVGEAPRVAKTRTFGCSLKWASKRASARQALDKWNKESASLKSVTAAEVTDLMQTKSDKLRLINVWATWCGACVAEFPELITINRMYRKRDFEMISISMDSPEQKAKALAFLQKQAASFTNLIHVGEDRDRLADALDPSWSGAMPYTILVDPEGKIIFRHTGMIDPLEMKRAIVDSIGRYFFKVSK